MKQKFNDRYPDLAFLASHFSSGGGRTPPEIAFDRNAFDEVEVLYVVGLAKVPVEVFSWLEAKPQRALVFIEANLESIATFPVDSFWDHPQVHLHYSEEDPIEALASCYPTDRIAVIDPNGGFDVERLIRRSVSVSALYSDVLYGHAIYRNVRHHFRNMSGDFDANRWKGVFKGIPLIICGGGPSLEDAFDDLKALKLKALILAGGAALPALVSAGIQPHLALALDPNEEEYALLSKARGYTGPILYSPRLHYRVRDLFNGPFGYLRTDTGGLFEHWLEKELGIDTPAIGPDLGSEAFSVTTLAVSLSQAFGCSSVTFCGVDLAYKGGKRYPSSLGDHESRGVHGVEMPLLRHNADGGTVETALKWVMEADVIGSFAKQHPEMQFVQASKGGLPIPNVRTGTLDELKEGEDRDLDRTIRENIASSSLSLDSTPALEKFDASLERSLHLCAKILKEYELGNETGKCVLYKFELQEEVAYTAVLDGLNAALSHLMERYHPKGDTTQREIAKFQELHRQIQEYIS